MDSTKVLIESLETLLAGASSTTYDDEFLVLDIKISALDDARPILIRLLEDERSKIIRYESAVVQAKCASNNMNYISYITRDEEDIVLQREILDDEESLCNNHTKLYNESLQDQQSQFEIDAWQRYFLLQDIGDCSECDVNTWVEITLDKQYLERQFKERLGLDLPQIASDLDKLHVLYWADLDDFHSMVEHKLLDTYTIIAELGKPCLFICYENAHNNGSDTEVIPMFWTTKGSK